VQGTTDFSVESVRNKFQINRFHRFTLGRIIKQQNVYLKICIQVGFSNLMDHQEADNNCTFIHRGRIESFVGIACEDPRLLSTLVLGSATQISSLVTWIASPY
jgi:hypothetical protein